MVKYERKAVLKENREAWNPGAMKTVTTPQQSSGTQLSQKKNPLQVFLHWLPFYLMGLPGLAYLFINNYIPLVGLQIAFKNFSYCKGMCASKWNGIRHFEFLFKSFGAFIKVLHQPSQKFFPLLASQSGMMEHGLCCLHEIFFTVLATIPLLAIFFPSFGEGSTSTVRTGNYVIQH